MTTCVSQHQKGKSTILDFNEASDDGVAVASGGPCANHLQSSLQANNHASTSARNFYRPDAVPAIQPAVSKH